MEIFLCVDSVRTDERGESCEGLLTAVERKEKLGTGTISGMMGSILRSVSVVFDDDGVGEGLES